MVYKEMPGVVITGADRGLGLSLCKEYLNRGYRVFAGKYLDDYNFLEELRIKNDNLHIIRLDMGSADSIAAARDYILTVTDSLDMLVSNAAIMGEGPMDIEAAWNFFRINALGPVLLTEKLLPLLDKGKMKRLCFVSSEVSCIVLMKHRGDSSYPYPMSKAGLNMGVRLLHNQLFEQGYSFRLFHPGWMKRRLQDGSLSEWALHDPDSIGEIAAKYFEAPLRDEHRLVMTDFNGYEWTY